MRAASTGLIVEVIKEIGWARLWDSATDSMLGQTDSVSRLMCRHGDRPCPRCDVTNLEGSSLIDHTLEDHLGR